MMDILKQAFIHFYVVSDCCCASLWVSLTHIFLILEWILNSYNQVFLFLVFYSFVRKEGGGTKGLTYYTIRMRAGCQKSRRKWITTNRERRETKIVNFDHEYVSNFSLVGLQFLMGADDDCNGNYNGLE